MSSRPNSSPSPNLHPHHDSVRFAEGKPARKPAHQAILAAHTVVTGYGHWLPNDPRGSGSDSVRKNDLKDLGEVHHGRKRVQPPRALLREFSREAEAILEHDLFWFDELAREVIAHAIGLEAGARGYTLYALAVCSNHFHFIARTHRDRSETIAQHLMNPTRDALHAQKLVCADHPVWAHRDYRVYLRTPSDIAGRIKYVNENPEKEGLVQQHWGCVTAYEG